MGDRKLSSTPHEHNLKDQNMKTNKLVLVCFLLEYTVFKESVLFELFGVYIIRISLINQNHAV